MIKLRLIDIKDWAWDDWRPKIGDTFDGEDDGINPDLYKIWYGKNLYKGLYRWRFESVEDKPEGWEVP